MLYNLLRFGGISVSKVGICHDFLASLESPSYVYGISHIFSPALHVRNQNYLIRLSYSQAQPCD